MDSPNSISAAGTGPGKDIVRAWFDTVINPLITAFELEHKQLKRKDWTWNHWRLQLESIRPVERHLEPEVLPNARQLFKYNQDLKELADQHDQSVNALWEGCGSLQYELERDPGFVGVYRKAILDENLTAIGSTVEKLFGRSDEQANVATLAEYAINERTHLPTHYTTHTLWNAWRDQFIEAMKNSESQELQMQYENLIVTGDHCLGIVDKAIILFEERRDQLSFEHDVAIVKVA